MNAIKKHLFYIVIGLIVLAALGLFVVVNSSISDDIAKALSDYNAKQTNLITMAKHAKEPNYIKTEEHVKEVTEYHGILDQQLKTINDTLVEKGKLELRFDPKPPTENRVEFDLWLQNDFRPKIKEKITKAGLDVSKADMPKLLFDEPTDPRSTDPTKHTDYRLRHLAITQEIIGILCDTTVKQTATSLRKDETKEEKTETVELRTLALEGLAIKDLDRRDVWSSQDGTRGTQDAQRWMGLPTFEIKTGTTPFTPLPYKFTKVELQVVAPFAVVGELIKTLETSTRFMAVVCRLDFLRSSPPYPLTEQDAPPMAGPDPKARQNNYYLEGPVRVSLELDLCEYGAEKTEMEAFKKLAGLK